MTRTWRSNLALALAFLALCAGQWMFGARADWLGVGGTVAGIGLHLLGAILALGGLRAQAAEPDVADRPMIPPAAWWLALAALAAVLRLVALGEVPYKVDGDAAAFALAGTSFLGPDPPVLIGTGWQAHTNLLLFLYSLAVRVAGRTVVGIRLLGALGGIAGVLAVGALGTYWWNRRVGLLAALATATLPFHLVFSRVGTEVIHMTWLLPLAALSVSRGWDARSPRWLVAAGAVTGLSQYFYPGARLIPILVVAQLALLARFERVPELAADVPWFERPLGEPSPLQRLLRGLGWVALGFGVVYGPMIAFFLGHPDLYTNRLSLVSITSGDWLQRQLERRTWWELALDQLRRAFLPFVYPIDGAPLWFLWPQYLGVADAALAILGGVGVFLAGATPRWLRWFLGVYFGLGMLLAGALTINSPMPSRYVIFVPGVALLIGYGLERLAAALRDLDLARPEWRGLGQGALAALLLAYVVVNVAGYVRHDTDTTWGFDPTSQMATSTGRYLQPLAAEPFDVLFLSTPLMYYTAGPALPYLAAKPGENLPGAVTCRRLTAELGTGTTVVLAPPGRIAELQELADALPVGQLEVLLNPRGQETGAVLRIAPQPSGVRLCATTAAAAAPVAQDGQAR